jgi:predicted DNA-binding transcriptional regulator AlpA
VYLILFQIVFSFELFLLKLKFKMDLNRPLYSLSIKEFLSLQNEAHEQKLLDLVQKVANDNRLENQKEESDTIHLADAAKLTGLKERSIYSKVSRLELPSISRGRPLLFSRAELQLWMKLGRPTIAEMELKRRKGEL